jgi:predicted ATPase
MRAVANTDQGAALASADMEKAVAAIRTTGQELFLPLILTGQATLYGRAGQAEKGLEVTAKALTRINKTEEHWYEAEVFRAQGELLLQLPKPDENGAEICFRKAMATGPAHGFCV